MELTLEILDKTHIRSDFDCGHPSLDNYIKVQASQDVKRNISVCYILSDNPEKVVAGYYTLSSHSIPLEDLPEDLAKKLPKSYKDVPAALLGRLAVSTPYKGNGLGELLLLDALNRCADLADSIGTLAVIVDPIDEKAVSFYKAYGFINLPDSERMFIPIKTVKASKAS
ncbi:GNAT family N-acetyltransferase [Mucilaginibacter sp. S1162]|uniref:GNAT family N-acetyltransferase n=1 Tax=Mucilaginibacter humi TaxID=2732510 RepID=A0ABX1W5U9_9SPHI|nr:GNAT family N-acetyltransferase [Mucilaginibacter humi]NNU33690.1 GNAT family N-acetyltransferase [Mucilaginibacter humi]